jgi:two-component system NtrC family sensor kinase
MALKNPPDLIIASLTLPGLTGKDLLVALRSQGLDVPVLVTAPQGEETAAIQAFRLGAKDYLAKPLREAEVVSALERALLETRLLKEREQLAEQLEESNRQLERRVRELTTLYGIGKAVTSTTDQAQLLDKLVEGSLYVTEADMGWILLQLEKSDQLILRAQRNLPAPYTAKLHRLWSDGVSELVMLSGQTLTIHGEGLSEFMLANFCQAAIIAPIKVRDQPIGVLCVARERPNPFTDRYQAMLEAVADYASISLVNARLFKALEARAKHLEEVVSQSHREEEMGWDQIDVLENGLRSVRSQAYRFLGEIKNEKARSRLDHLIADIDKLLIRLRTATGGNLEKETRTPDISSG